MGRLSTFERGVVPMTITYASPQARLILTGAFDYRNDQGWVIARDPNGGPAATIAWDADSVAIFKGGPVGSSGTVPSQGWTVRPMTATASTLDAALLVALNLGSDRPDNPQLLRNNGATWEGRTTIDGVQVDRITGPIPAGASKSYMTYFITDNGEILRARGQLDTDAEATIDLPLDKEGTMPDLGDLLTRVTATPAPTP